MDNILRMRLPDPAGLPITTLSGPHFACKTYLVVPQRRVAGYTPKTVVCIHSNSASSISFHRQVGGPIGGMDHVEWGCELGSRISPQDYLLLIDLPGHGDSDIPAERIGHPGEPNDLDAYSFDWYAWVVARTVHGVWQHHSMAPTEVVLLGWSLGGQIAYSMLALYADWGAEPLPDDIAAARDALVEKLPLRVVHTVVWGAPAVPSDNLMAGFNSFPEAAMMGQAAAFSWDEAKTFTQAAGLPVSGPPYLQYRSYNADGSHDADRTVSNVPAFVDDAMRAYGPARALMIASTASPVGSMGLPRTDAAALVRRCPIPLTVVVADADQGVNADYVRGCEYRNARIIELAGNHAVHYGNWREFNAAVERSVADAQ